MPIYTTSSNRCNTNRNASTDKWIKIARVTPGLGSNDDTVSSTFLVNISGEERTEAYATGLTMLVSLKYTTGTGVSSSFYDADGTYLKAETIVAHEIDSFVPGNDLKLLVVHDYNYAAELWMRVKPAASDVFVEKLSGSKSGNDGSADSFEVINGTQSGVTNNYADDLPTAIKKGDNTGGDRPVTTISGAYSDKLVNNLHVVGYLDVESHIRHVGNIFTKMAFDTDKVSFSAGSGGSERMAIKSTEVVINDLQSDSYNFRVEGSGDDHTLFVDAQSALVGIGTNLPTTKLDVNGDATLSGDIHVFGGDAFIQKGSGQANVYLTRREADLATGEEVGRIMFRGTENNTDKAVLGAITMRLTENFEYNSNHGCALDFWTTPNAESSNTRGMILTGDNKLHVSGDVQVGGNVIRASDGGSTITMDDNDNVTIAGDLTVSGNDIKGSGGTAIKMDSSNNVAITGNIHLEDDPHSAKPIKLITTVTDDTTARVSLERYNVNGTAHVTNVKLCVTGSIAAMDHLQTLNDIVFESQGNEGTNHEIRCEHGPAGSNRSGRGIKIKTGAGTGAAVASSIDFQVAPIGSSGSTRRSHVSAVEITGTKKLLCKGDVEFSDSGKVILNDSKITDGRDDEGRIYFTAGDPHPMLLLADGHGHAALGVEHGTGNSSGLRGDVRIEHDHDFKVHNGKITLGPNTHSTSGDCTIDVTETTIGSGGNPGTPGRNLTIQAGEGRSSMSGGVYADTLGGDLIFKSGRASGANGSSTITFFTSATSDSHPHGGTKGLTEKMRIHTSGFVGIGRNSPQYRLDVNGVANATQVRAGGNVLTSDIRLKENIENMPDMLSTVMNMRPVQFDWKKGARDEVLDNDKDRIGDFGFIAQELEELLPNMVSEGNGDERIKAVGYSKMVTVLTKAIQELKLENDSLKSRIEALESK